MHNMSDDWFAEARLATLPWAPKTELDQKNQVLVQGRLSRRAGGVFGHGCYVAPDARVFTDTLALGDRSWIATGAVLRGDIAIGADCSVRAYAHLAGKIALGDGCRIASFASIYALGEASEDTADAARGVVLHENVSVGEHAVIVDGVEIGANCTIAAGAVVTRSFPAGQTIAGNPATAASGAPVARAGETVPAREPAGTKLVYRQKAMRKSPPSPAASQGGTLRSHIFADDPYGALPPLRAEDLQGWDSADPLFAELIGELKPALIVEVGSWKGASAIHMADICAAQGLEAEIVCVDTWLGNWQHWARAEGEGSRADLGLVAGYPTLYYQFMSNVVHRQHQGTITPLPLPSPAAADLLEHYGLRPSFLYLDSAPEYAPAIADLRAWLKLLTKGGVLLGDDYLWPGVQAAVQEIEAEGKWSVQISENKFVMRRK